jgi:hypothetical protein
MQQVRIQAKFEDIDSLDYILVTLVNDVMLVMH